MQTMTPKIVAQLSLVALASVALVGCGSKSDSPSTSSTGTSTLKVSAFKGGFDVDFYEAVAREWEAKNPGKKVEFEGDPRIWEKLRPRFIAGDPPDLLFPGWGMDHWALKEEGQLLALDEALATPPAEGEGTWGDTFEPSLLKYCQQDGKTWMLPQFFSMLGWWYDPGVFAKNGWTPPKTFDDLRMLGEKIKAAGMAPIVFQGKYPYYMLHGMLLPWAHSIGGPEAIRAAENLEPGAWSSPAFLEAAKMIDELNKKGFFQRGSVGMTHTEAQTQFLQGKAAMVMCGTWLRSEMRDAIPAGAAMEFFLPPVVPGGAGDPSAVIIKIEPWMVASKSKDPQSAISLYKEITSLSNSKKFVKEKGTLTAIKGSDQTELMKELVTPAAVFKASKDVWAIQFADWYPTLNKEMEDALTGMLNGTETPESFLARVEKKAEEVRNDETIVKRKR
jgi:N-acetylglucosamine transport system substrate-binding protein